MRWLVCLGAMTLAIPAHGGAGDPHFGALYGKIPSGKLAKLGIPSGVKVAGRLAGCPARDHLLDGDVILAVDGKPVTEPGDMDAATRALADRGTAPLTILRDGKQLALELDLYAGPGCSGQALGGNRPAADSFASPILDDGTLAPWAAPGNAVQPGTSAALRADQRFADPCELGKHLAEHTDRPDFQYAVAAVNMLHPQEAPAIATCMAGGSMAPPPEPEPEPAAAPAQESAPAGETDVAGKLRELADLHKQGLITDEEFAAAKAKLLGL